MASATKRRRSLGGWLLLALVLAAAAVASDRSTPVAAHALLVRADPPVNAQLRSGEVPAVFTLYFSEALERAFSDVRVLDADRTQAADGVEFDDSDDALMRVGVPPLAPGFYAIVWETLSKVDGHRITGSYPLTVLNADGSVPPGVAPSTMTGVSGDEARLAPVLTKWLLLLVGSLLVGAIVFALWVAPTGDAATAVGRRALFTALFATLALGAASGAEILLRARDLGGLDRLDLVFETTWGERWLIRTLLLAPLVMFLALALRERKRLSLSRKASIASLALAGAFLALVASTSHAAAGTGAAWATLSDFVHLTAASVWIGMLFQLVLLFRWAVVHLSPSQRPPVLASALQRFSFFAVASLAILLVSGVFNALVQIARPADLLDTGFGQVLLLKLLLLIPLLVAGAANAYVFRPELVVGVETGAEHRRAAADALAELERLLSRTVRIETAIAATVLLAVAVLVQLPPSRTGFAAPEQAGGTLVATEAAEGVSATLIIDPNEPGLNTFSVYLTGDAASVLRVRLRFNQVGAAEAFGSSFVLEPSNPPTFYIGRGAFLSQPGEWNIGVDLRRDRGNDLLLPFEVNVTGIGGKLSQERDTGAFRSPLPLNAAAVGLLALSLLLAVGLVVGSVRRPELAGGYLEVPVAAIAGLRLRPAVSLSLLLFAGLGLGLLLGGHSHLRLGGSEAREGNPLAASEQSIDRGRILFAQNCSRCHGETGRGDGPLAASLPLQPANLYDHIPYHPDQFFFNVITDGIGGIMPAFGSAISEEDRWNILNFLRAQFGQPAAER